MRITVIEDNEGVAKGIAYVLRDQGHAVDIIHDGDEADQFLRQDTSSDVIVLDVNLPGINGIDLLKALRNRGDARPVILLTARSETSDRVAGLDAGADDYLVKPFEMAELEARIRALSRRQAAPLETVRQIGALIWDPSARKITVADEPLDIPRRELALFEALAQAQGRTLAKDVLLDKLYGIGTDVEESVVEVYVSRLRKRLKPHGLTIRVKRGLGYELEEAPA